MNTPGTIGRPAPYGPPLNPAARFTGTRTLDTPAAAARPCRHEQNRTHTVQLIPEMARSQLRDRAEEAESQRTAQRLAAARRLQRRSRRLGRRAERAAQRARRAMALAVMQ